jgi:ParB-like chromosome segregation protein Spo0J
MIISGERRYKASLYAKLKTIKAHIIKADDKKILELSLVENIQRDDLTDFEKAKFINQVWATGHYAKKQDLAKAIGKPQSYISKVFKAVKLSDEIIQDIEENKKDIGLEVLHELSNVKDKDKQLELYLDGAKRDDIRDYNQSQKDSKISRAKKYKKSMILDGEDSECVIDHLSAMPIDKKYKITIEEL